ncbi:four helix bundle protein [Oceaniferula spumae]|uniref:Four helix bundle protein n=1 Tax=Oceaniferula spumae TaxID=2979115 RepID=A0AAT9FS77_9BACT
MGKFAASAKELEVYKMAYGLSMELFELSKKFPAEEKYALTSQIRRSSRSVCANLREAWAKRRYQAHFISKLTDCDGENQETDTHMDFARDCQYIDPSTIQRLQDINQQIGRMLGKMITNPKPWITA